MSTPEPAAPGPDAPAAEEAAPDAPVPGASAVRHRTHPITPLVSGWKIVIGLIAVISAQNIARLADDFTVTRALIGAGLLAAAILVAILLSAVSWWFTTYAVDEDGVSLHKGAISKSREYAPRARIESVTVERPLLARMLGLSKVRVEVAGGGASYLDIEYVKSADAEQLRQSILGVAALARDGGDAAGGDGAGGEGAAAAGADATAAPSSQGALEEILYDGVTDGELIAKIPTERLGRSLLRDVGFLIGTVMSIVGVLVAIALAIWQDGFSFAVIIALLPTAIAVPKYVFGRIESGWGFVSRLTDRGLRMRRGLANTRTDNIASGRIQRFELRRPLLWRAPDWTAASVTVAGIEDDDQNGAANVLPVGTREELRATLGHLAAPLGTADDLATIERLLTVPAREIEGLRTPVPLYWFSRRTRVSVLLPGALVHRSGLLTKTVEIIPRDRLQDLTLEDDPFGRRLGILDLKVGVAGHAMTLSALARRDALELHRVLAHDAATLRRYRDREQWPQPALSLAAGPVASGPRTAEEQR